MKRCSLHAHDTRGGQITTSSRQPLCPQEMYAFTLACYNAGIQHIDLHKKMMAQPPWDTGALRIASDDPLRILSGF